MDLHHLRTFRAVVATGSVRSAAARLNYSPSSVSQQLAALQQSCGVTLFARVGRGLEPTSAGLALAGRVDDLMVELGDIEEMLGDLRSGRTTTVRIGYISSLGATWLPAVVGALARDFPEIGIDLRVTDDVEPTRRRFDLQVVVRDHSFAPPAGFRSEPLADDPYVVALPRDHALAASDAVPLRALQGERWVDSDVAGGICRQITLDACASVGFQPSFRIETHDYTTALALVEAGLGVTVLPAIGARSAPPRVQIRQVIDPTPVRSIHAVTALTSADTAPVVRAVELLRTVAAQSSAGKPKSARSPVGTSAR